MTNRFAKNKLIVAIAISVFMIVLFCSFVTIVYATETTPTETVTETIHKCEFGNEKWTWAVDKDGLASYVLKLTCDGCGNEKTYKNHNKLYPAKNEKTVAPTCTREGTNFYSVEIPCDEDIFIGTHEEKIPATGHSYQKTETTKYEISVDQQNKQSHYLKCTNANCPDKGKVNLAYCSATGKNVAVCGSKSTCDVCKNTFGDTLEHKYTNGVCEHCKKEHTPHTWENGTCSGCNFVHKDHNWSFGVCRICSYKHDPHNWDQGLCTVCGFVSGEHQWKDGVCEECKLQHSGHQWKDGICEICLLAHEHEKWANGKCFTCKVEHDQHEWTNGICKICQLKHDPHKFKDGVCETCNIVCEHNEFVDGSCNGCGYSDYKIYIGSVQQYQLQTKDNVILKTNGSANKFQKILIDNYPVDQQYIKFVGKDIAITSDFLNRLSVGEHDLTIVYSDGQIETSVTIIEAQAKRNVSSIWLLVLLIIIAISAIGLAVLIFIKRVKTYDDDDETLAEKYTRQNTNNKVPQTTQRRPPIYTKEDEQQIMRKLEDEIGMNVSQYLDEDKHQ